MASRGLFVANQFNFSSSTYFADFSVHTVVVIPTLLLSLNLKFQSLRAPSPGGWGVVVSLGRNLSLSIRTVLRDRANGISCVV